MEYTDIDFDHVDQIATLTVNRPDRRNAYGLATIEQIHGVLDILENNTQIRVLIMTGSGSAFCAGLDMKEGFEPWEKDGKIQGRYRVQKRLTSVFIRLREIPQPVIAAVRGPAVGGGFVLAAAADVRVADPTARFGAAFIKLGLSAGDCGATWFLPRLVGPAMAAEMLYTGRLVAAEEAARIRLVNRVVPDGMHLEAARSIASEMVTNSPFGIRMTKELLNLSLDVPGLRQTVELENRTQAMCLLTEDFAEAVAAYQERRPPSFRDR